MCVCVCVCVYIRGGGRDGEIFIIRNLGYIIRGGWQVSRAAERVGNMETQED